MGFDNRREHAQDYPTARKIRRACNRELYRTIKKLKIWLPPESIIQAEDIYYRKVAAHLHWIMENGSNRQALADWWEENVAPEIAEIWNVEPHSLARSFREAFGG